MGSLVPLGSGTKLVPKIRHSTPAAPRQLALVLDNARLRGLTPAERQMVIRSLARLLLEAGGVGAREDGDDNA